MQLNEYFQQLDEALITFGGQAYPKFNTVIIMAGGAGSGKGFVKDNLVGAEGYTFDVDAIKSLAMRAPKLNAMVKKEFGVDLSSLNLKTPEDVARLHMIIGDELGIDDKRTQTLYKSVLSGNASRKPNIIFDVTLKDLRKLEKLTSSVKALGYSSQDIHIVWVVNDIEVAKQQNLSRARTVPEEILVNTHRGVSSTMNDIVSMGSGISKYMDGDIVFAFNKFKVDSELVKSGQGGQYITKANYFYVKRKGHAPIAADKLSQDIRAKLRAYTPKNVEW